jgi:hypothetical protein
LILVAWLSRCKGEVRECGTDTYSHCWDDSLVGNAFPTAVEHRQQYKGLTASRFELQALQEETGRTLELQARVAALATQQPQQPPSQHSSPQQPAQQPDQQPRLQRPLMGDGAAAPEPAAGLGLDPVEEDEEGSEALSPVAAASGMRQLEAELEAAHTELQGAHVRLEAEAAQNRAKQKLLAKEVRP